MESDGDSVLRTPVKDCSVSLRDISQWSVISTKEYFYREPSGENVQNDSPIIKTPTIRINNSLRSGPSEPKLNLAQQNGRPARLFERISTLQPVQTNRDKRPVSNPISKHGSFPVNVKRSTKLTEPEEFKFATDKLGHRSQSVKVANSKTDEIPIALVDDYLKNQLRVTDNKVSIKRMMNTEPKSPHLRVTKRLKTTKNAVKPSLQSTIVQLPKPSVSSTKFIPRITIPKSPKITKSTKVISKTQYSSTKNQTICSSKSNLSKPVENSISQKSNTMLTRKLPRVAMLPPKNITKRLSPKKSRVALPLKLTTPKPFELSTDKRGEIYKEKFNLKLKQEQEQQKHFKATPAPSTDYIFTPAPSQKPLTAPHSPNLHLAQRLARRAEFDRCIDELEQKRTEIREQLKKEEQIEDAKEIERLRKEATFHATPIQKYKPVVIKKSSKELTTPISPHFVLKQKYKFLRAKNKK